MTKQDVLGAFLFCILVFIGLPCKLGWDFCHPESWTPHTVDDPRIYGWGVPLCWALCLFVFDSIFRQERKRKRRIRLAALLLHAEDLLRRRRFEEAEAVLKECQALCDKARPT